MVYSAENFCVGDRFECVYNGRVRLCEAVEVRATFMRVSTPDGFRTFSYCRIGKLSMIHMASA